MRRLVAIFAVFAALVAAQVAEAAFWPAACTTFSCVNQHLNDLDRRLRLAEGNIINLSVCIRVPSSCQPLLVRLGVAERNAGLLV